MDAVTDVVTPHQQSRFMGTSGDGNCDHSCTGVSDAMYNMPKIQAIYGMEAYVVNDEAQLIVKKHDERSINDEIIIFDVETTIKLRRTDYLKSVPLS